MTDLLTWFSSHNLLDYWPAAFFGSVSFILYDLSIKRIKITFWDIIGVIASILFACVSAIIADHSPAVALFIGVFSGGILKAFRKSQDQVGETVKQGVFRVMEKMVNAVQAVVAAMVTTPPTTPTPTAPLPPLANKETDKV